MDTTWTVVLALLYVNRRGSAYGKQYRYFNLERKIRLNKAMLKLSNNTQDNLWITETNWPLLDTAPLYTQFRTSRNDSG